MNIVNYKPLEEANITVLAPITLYDLIEASNPGFKEQIRKDNIQLNSLRIHVHIGLIGFRFDGIMVSPTTFIGVEEAQHLLENCDLTKVSVCGVEESSIATIQIGHI